MYSPCMSFYLGLPFRYQFLPSQYKPALNCVMSVNTRVMICAPTDTICCKNLAYFIHPKSIEESLGPTCDTLHLHSSDTTDTTFVLFHNCRKRLQLDTKLVASTGGFSWQAVGVFLLHTPD